MNLPQLLKTAETILSWVGIIILGALVLTGRMTTNQAINWLTQGQQSLAAQFQAQQDSSGPAGSHPVVTPPAQ